MGLGRLWENQDLAHTDTTDLTYVLGIDPGARSVYIDSTGVDNARRTYLIQNDTVVNSTFTVDRWVTEDSNAFNKISDNLLAFLDEYVQFSRPATTINNLQQVYELINSVAHNGFFAQRNVNDLQNLLLLENVDDVRMENIPLPVHDGRLDFPIAAPEGESINPLYVGHWPRYLEWV